MSEVRSYEISAHVLHRGEEARRTVQERVRGFDARNLGLLRGAPQQWPSHRGGGARTSGDGDHRAGPKWHTVHDRRPVCRNEGAVGGFFLINARDLNEAIQVASKFPSVRVGGMEVRR